MLRILLMTFSHTYTYEFQLEIKPVCMYGSVPESILIVYV